MSMHVAIDEALNPKRVLDMKVRTENDPAGRFVSQGFVCTGVDIEGVPNQWEEFFKRVSAHPAFSAYFVPSSIATQYPKVISGTGDPNQYSRHVIPYPGQKDLFIFVNMVYDNGAKAYVILYNGATQTVVGNIAQASFGSLGGASASAQALTDAKPFLFKDGADWKLGIYPGIGKAVNVYETSFGALFGAAHRPINAEELMDLTVRSNDRSRNGDTFLGGYIKAGCYVSKQNLANPAVVFNLSLAGITYARTMLDYNSPDYYLGPTGSMTSAQTGTIAVTPPTGPATGSNYRDYFRKGCAIAAGVVPDSPTFSAQMRILDVNQNASTVQEMSWAFSSMNEIEQVPGNKLHAHTKYTMMPGHHPVTYSLSESSGDSTRLRPWIWKPTYGDIYGIQPNASYFQPPGPEYFHGQHNNLNREGTQTHTSLFHGKDGRPYLAVVTVNQVDVSNGRYPATYDIDIGQDRTSILAAEAYNASRGFSSEPIRYFAEPHRSDDTDDDTESDYAGNMVVTITVYDIQNAWGVTKQPLTAQNQYEYWRIIRAHTSFVASKDLAWPHAEAPVFADNPNAPFNLGGIQVQVAPKLRDADGIIDDSVDTFDVSIAGLYRTSDNTQAGAIADNKFIHLTCTFNNSNSIAATEPTITKMDMPDYAAVYEMGVWTFIESGVPTARSGNIAPVGTITNADLGYMEYMMPNKNNNLIEDPTNVVKVGWRNTWSNELSEINIGNPGGDIRESGNKMAWMDFYLEPLFANFSLSVQDLDNSDTGIPADGAWWPNSVSPVVTIDEFATNRQDYAGVSLLNTGPTTHKDPLWKNWTFFDQLLPDFDIQGVRNDVCFSVLMDPGQDANDSGSFIIRIDANKLNPNDTF